jgi:hypothetical protein
MLRSMWCAGIVATLAVILMSLLRRDDSDYGGYDDDGDQVGHRFGSAGCVDAASQGLSATGS